MLKTFPIDFIRQIFEQKLFEEHQKNPELFGGKNQVNIFSFYEQLKTQDEVNRFVENYRALTNQQNRTKLVLNGVLVSPENPTITNLYSSTIIPMSWTCSMRCTLDNRDASIVTINNLIKELKGRKVDVAQLECVDDDGNKYTEPFMVGTIGQNNGEPQLKNGDYIGSVENANDIVEKLTNFQTLGFDIEYKNYNLYCENDEKLKVVKAIKGDNIFYGTDTIIEELYDDNDFLSGAIIKRTTDETYTTKPLLYAKPTQGQLFVELINSQYVIIDCAVEMLSYELVNGHLEFTLKYTILEPTIQDSNVVYVQYAMGTYIYLLNYSFAYNDGTITDIVFPPEHTSFEKYKVSLSFDAIRCDEPRNLNEKEYCELSFGGSATLVNNGVKLGNDLLKLSIHKNKIVANPTVDLSSSSIYYLEPLEMPSGSNANTQISQLMSNKFISNTHTDSLSLTLQYTFIADENVELLNQWFDYARYGTQDTTSSTLDERISPNIVYDVVEYWSGWGNYKTKQVLAKITGDISIENTESDTLTLGVTFQVQGENN